MIVSHGILYQTRTWMERCHTRNSNCKYLKTMLIDVQSCSDKSLLHLSVFASHSEMVPWCRPVSPPDWRPPFVRSETRLQPVEVVRQARLLQASFTPPIKTYWGLTSVNPGLQQLTAFYGNFSNKAKFCSNYWENFRLKIPLHVACQEFTIQTCWLLTALPSL